LAGNDASECADPRPVANAIRQAATGLTDRLGPKVTVIVDGNGALNLSGLKADIRLVATAETGWAIVAGGHFFGVTDHPVEAALAVLSLLAGLGPDARATDLNHIDLLAGLGHLCCDAPRPIQAQTTPVGRIGHSDIVGIGLPFGASPWEALVGLAAIA